MTLVEFLTSHAKGALGLQKPDGSMPAGHNGPYHHPETPVRNTAHWLITFCRLYGMTADRSFGDAATRAAEYLYHHPEPRPLGWAFHHRMKPGKDGCNGLVGQAWTFEALAAATDLTDDPKFARRAEEVFFQHLFDSDSGLWHRLEIDGTCLDVDRTFNHQLWFAACAGLIRGERRAELLARLNRFLDQCSRNVEILADGLIFHHIKRARPGRFPRRVGRRIKLLMWQLRDLNGRQRHAEFVKVRAKSVGYHAFNLYAFALLKATLPDHPWWSAPEFSRAVAYLKSREYQLELEGCLFGYPYNPPGFEVPFALCAFERDPGVDIVEYTQHWIERQHERCWPCHPSGIAPACTEDPVTHSARVYECTRLPGHVLDSVEIPRTSASQGPAALTNG